MQNFWKLKVKRLKDFTNTTLIKRHLINKGFSYDESKGHFYLNTTSYKSIAYIATNGFFRFTKKREDGSMITITGKLSIISFLNKKKEIDRIDNCINEINNF